MSTSKIDNASTAVQNGTKEFLRILVITAIALTIGIIGTLILEPGSQAHYSFAAILLVGTAIWL